MPRRPPRSTLSSSSAASDVYKRQRPTSDVCAAWLCCSVCAVLCVLCDLAAAVPLTDTSDVSSSIAVVPDAGALLYVAVLCCAAASASVWLLCCAVLLCGSKSTVFR
eukprot:TRINITY_DN45245_c0_g1_i1.p1 TRINITY_DN45245_c0_g1~~TRINITY_DN45245_c0_g1_i1.p1  ORF type:complete len:107 (+),score=41.04 TRINITY_DN45245_c0_g1_i1:116-436(+)